VGILELLNNPHLLHGIAVHVPIALGLLGLPFVCVGCAAVQSAALRRTVCVLYLLLAAASFGASWTGEAALTTLKGGLAPEVRALAEWHQTLAKNVWIPALVTAVLVLLCGVKSERLRGALAVLAILASLVTGLWTGGVAYYGTVMLYNHAVGVTPSSPIVPTAPAPVTPAPAPAPQILAPAAAPPQATPPPPAAVAPTPATPPSPNNSPPATAAPQETKKEGYVQGVKSYLNGAAKNLWPTK
jgi:uncharacterized membrane protein